MCDIWIMDLEKAIQTFRKKLPNEELFNSITGSFCGDIIITTSSFNKYLIEHITFKIFKENENGYWERI